jgi:hypothetical protein
VITGYNLSRIAFGADPSPVEPFAERTPGQLWHHLLTLDPNERLEVLANLQESARLGYESVVQDLRGKADYLARIEAARSKVAWSPPAEEDCMCRGAFHYPNCPHGPKDGE